MNQILQGEPMTIFGDGSQTRAFSDIGDVAPVLASAIDQPAALNEVFNVGGDQTCSLNELASKVAAAMGVSPEVRYLPARHEVQHAHAGHEKARRVFGALPQTSLDDGLRVMAEWVKQYGARSAPPFQGIEIRKNLPASWALG
jgi:UDP-glucose 4-epimerase